VQAGNSAGSNADSLKTRHTAGLASKLVPMKQFRGAAQ
jgi:hypothetical protein